MRRALLTATLLLAAIAPARAQEDAATRQFGAWTGDCRADGYCAAHAEAAPGYAFRIGRHAEETYWELSFVATHIVADGSRPFTVSVDGTAEIFDEPREIAAYGAGTDYFLLGKGAQAVLDRLMPGRALDVAFTDADGAMRQVDFPLEGLTATLIWIDEHQGRLGSERVAEAAPAGLAPINPDAARLADVPAALLAQRDADTDCQPIADLANGTDIVIDAGIGEGMALYILPCWSAAYNFGWKAYIEPAEGIYSMLALPEYSPEDGWTATTHIINYSYDPATKVLTTDYRGRGLGDCGSGGTYRWQPYTFRLTEFREKRDCDGVDGPFPLVFPASP